MCMTPPTLRHTQKQKQQILESLFMRPKEMAKWLGELAAFLEDPISIPSTHVAAQNCL